MPSKTKTQIRKSRRIAKRGATDLSNGHLNPRSLRVAMAQGLYAMNTGKPPGAPPEWRPWKKDRFNLSILAAHWFLKGKELDEIGPLVGKGKVGTDITRQRISQMVGEGCKFLLTRRFVRERESAVPAN